MDILTKPEAVLFDWDNTLADNWGLIIKSLNSTFEKFGHEIWSEEEADLKINKSARDLFPEIFSENSEEAIKHFYDFFEENHINELDFFPETKKIIELLYSNNTPAGIVSNKRGDLLRKEVEHSQLSPFLQSVVGANDAEFDKPHRAPLDYALVEMRIDPVSKEGAKSRSLWYVGDSHTDLEAALHAGFIPVIIRTKRGTFDTNRIKSTSKVFFFDGLGQFYSYCTKNIF